MESHSASVCGWKITSLWRYRDKAPFPASALEANKTALCAFTNKYLREPNRRLKGPNNLISVKNLPLILTAFVPSAVLRALLLRQNSSRDATADGAKVIELVPLPTSLRRQAASCERARDAFSLSTKAQHKRTHAETGRARTQRKPNNEIVKGNFEVLFAQKAK
jgi:hypothetical protein